jgi:hypothetical protein
MCPVSSIPRSAVPENARVERQQSSAAFSDCRNTGWARISRRAIGGDSTVGPVCVPQPEEDGGDGEHGMVARGQLVVAGGDGPVLLEAVDGPLHDVALPVGRPVEPHAAARCAGAGSPPRSRGGAGRWSLFGLPVAGFWGGSSGSSLANCSSVSSCRRTIPPGHHANANRPSQ